MTVSAKRKAVYDDLYDLPENMTGQIIEGELQAFPRPHYRHANAVSAVGSELKPPYQFGRGGGPGGWIILIEPEVKLGENLLVPDLAGWKKERLAAPPQENWTTVPPDWVCEILCPNTYRLDRTRKMDIYAEHGVAFLWLVDPLTKILETFKLQDGKWLVLKNYAENDKARAEPFPEVEIDLANLWWE
ncbi:MAG: Uma2 family endonuclease [Thermodesulfobacteriota bacterium]